MNERVAAFDRSADVAEGPGVRSEVVTLGPFAVARNVHEPGWRWTTHVGEPGAYCATRHIGYALTGRLAIELDTGERFEIGAGELFDIPEGHDGWVVGDEPFTTIEWLGARTWMRGSGSFADRQLATIVITDIVGSTELARQLGGSGWDDLIAAYEHAVREALTGTGGQEIKLTGDGVLAVYSSAARALQGAQALRESGVQLGLTTRTAVHAGEVTFAEGDVHGIAVHEAARVLGIATADEILVTAGVVGLVSDAGFRFEDRGEHQLKGLDGARKVLALAQ